MQPTVKHEELDILQPKTLDEVRYERAKLSLRFGIYALILNGVIWFVFDIIMGQQPIILLNLLLVVVCGVLFFLYRHASYRITAYASYFIFFTFTCLVSAFDLPDTNIPRSQNLFFFALAMYPYILFYKEKKWVPVLLSLLATIAFNFFRFSDFSLQTTSSVPADIRLYVALGISISASLAVATVIHIIHADLQTQDKSHQQLSEAIFQDQLELYYQPQVNKTGKLIGAEALIRWNHPTLGILSPNKFIPYAEKSGGIIAIGTWILETACNQLVEWQKHEHTKDLVLSINVTAPEMQQQDFVEKIKHAISSSNINPTLLKIELTETTIMDDMNKAIDKIANLKQIGVSFTLDDFGTGYSSLNVLKILPLEEIKIDKSFVDDINNSEENNSPIVDTLINLSKQMQISCLAEGIESEPQWIYLKEQGCNHFQGYFFGKPMKIATFNQFAQNNLEKFN